MDDETYATAGADEGSPVGAHFRHVFDHYQVLLGGLAGGRIDYDARRRDPRLERERGYAIDVALGLRNQLSHLTAEMGSRPLQVSTRSLADEEEPDWSGSTVRRELQFLVSHTVHHCALIKQILRQHGLRGRNGIRPGAIHEGAPATSGSMCTLSWLPVRGGYSLFFNRDESPLRGPEVPAAVHRWDDVTLVAPLDSDQGGTWIAANEFGVTVAVLNRYGPEMVRTTAPRSRGQLVRSLATTPSPDLVRHRLAASALTDYQPFTLATTAPDSPVYLWRGTVRASRSGR
jgi:hypothetical protein